MNDLFNLSGQVAVVSGASSGIGVDMAKAYARYGANIVVTGRRKERLDQVVEEIKEIGVDCIGVACDVTDTESVENCVKEIMDHFGRIDILHNNAGYGATKEAELLTDEEWNMTVDVDLTGTFKMSRAVAREAMIPQKYGRIINTASMFGLVGTMATPTSPYAAAKGGVVNLTRQLAAEWAKYNITVNAICPGTFPTELTIDLLETEEYKAYTKTVVPVGRSGVDGELDSTVVYLASPKSGYVTGQSIAVDGGYTCI